MHKDKLVIRLKKDLEKYAKRLDGREKALLTSIRRWERRQTKDGALVSLSVEGGLAGSAPWDYAQDSLQEWIDDALTKVKELFYDNFKLEKFKKVLEREMPD